MAVAVFPRSSEQRTVKVPAPGRPGPKPLSTEAIGASTMKLERLTPTDFGLHLQAEELAAVVAAVRCALEPGCAGVNPATHETVSRFLADYDEQATAFRARFAGSRPASIRLDPPTAEDVQGRVMYDPF